MTIFRRVSRLRSLFASSASQLAQPIRKALVAVPCLGRDSAAAAP